MKARLSEMKSALRQPWLLSILFAAAVPVFPEYICPVLAIASLLAAHYDARARKSRFMIGPLGKLLLFVMLYMAVGVLYSATPFISFGTLMMWVITFVIYLAMVTVLTDRQRFETALFCICVVVGIVGALACAQYILKAILDIHVPLCFWDPIDQAVYRYFPISMEIGTSADRACSTFTNPNILAEYLAMAIPFVVYYSFNGRSVSARILARICLVAGVGGVAFSFSRGAYLALAIIALVLAVANYRKIMLIVLSIGSAILLIPDSVLGRLLSVGSMDASISERFDIWKLCIESFTRHPIFGLGPGIQNSWDMLAAGGVDAPHAHNIILQLLVEGGLILLILVALLLYRHFRNGLTLVRHSPETHRLGVIMLAFLASFLMDGMVEFPFMTPKLLCAFMMALALSDGALAVFAGEELPSVVRFLCIRQDAASLARRSIALDPAALRQR